MDDNSNDKEFEQLSIFDILQMPNDAGKELSSDDLTAAIEKLQEWQARARHREKVEQEQRERKLREEQEKQEAHISEVTCMDLLLDWENLFNSDERAQGVHVDSHSDALVMSLNTLGKVDIEYMSSITGMEYKDVIGALRGSIYQNPQTWDECFTRAGRPPTNIFRVTSCESDRQYEKQIKNTKGISPKI